MKTTPFAHGVIATTHVDRQGEAMTKHALEGVVQHIQENVFWLQVSHDGMMPPIGRVANAVLRGRDDGHFEVFAEQLLFDPKAYPLIADLGFTARAPEGNTEASGTECLEPPPVVLSYDPHVTDAAEVEATLAGGPPQLQAEGCMMRKSLTTPWEVALAFGASSAAYYFGKAFFTKLGDRAGDAVSDVAGEVLQAIRSALGRLVAKAPGDHARVVGVELELPSGITLHGYVRNPSVEQAEAMFTDLGSLWGIGLGLDSQASLVGIDKMVYEYSSGAGEWLPLYYTSRAGEVYVADTALVQKAFDDLRAVLGECEAD